MPDIVASQARSTYDSNNGSTIRDRAASSAGDSVNSNWSGLI